MLSLASRSRRFITPCARQCRPCTQPSSSRALSSLPPRSTDSQPFPWFMDPTDGSRPARATIERSLPPHLSHESTLPPLPADLPASSPLAHLHATLLTSPHLESGTLLVREPVKTDLGPALPLSLPKGRRKRGGTYFGEGLGEELESGGIWEWIMIAQVKDGAENRGAIESVIRQVRKTLLTSTPPVVLPPNSKRTVEDGWAMLDAGDFAVHVHKYPSSAPSAPP
ncbi:hypothetical protein BXZ70DRAFT_759933 [Cristinia sonorae]|uniref:Uncharacterized protein n=1 Tax=Cristinia sonorae TaxID=1940300 RepID=A0A8K0UUN3_9AGAR|nr:hypothetical protein BXZ70DRAFT_759933 [Cristinia sonorae]